MMNYLRLIFKILLLTSGIIMSISILSLFITVIFIGLFWNNKLRKILEKYEKKEMLRELKKITWKKNNLELFEKFLMNEKDNNIKEIKEVIIKNIKVIYYIHLFSKIATVSGIILTIIVLLKAIYGLSL